MSFALIVKREILSLEYSYKSAIELISGIIATSYSKPEPQYILNINNSQVSWLLRDLLNQMKIPHQSTIENKNYIWLVDFPYQANLAKIKTPSWYFAGAFIGGGSISKLNSTSYHLEIQLRFKDVAQAMMEYLNLRTFDFNLIERRKMSVIYLKKSDQIGDFLKAIQAFQALLRFEDERINRDYKNHFNRYSNLDAYNLQKMAKSNVEFKKMVTFIHQKKLTSLFSKKHHHFFQLKLDNPYLPLKDLTTLYNEKYQDSKTKSGINHYLLKLKAVYKAH